MAGSETLDTSSLEGQKESFRYEDAGRTAAQTRCFRLSCFERCSLLDAKKQGSSDIPAGVTGGISVLPSHVDLF